MASSVTIDRVTKTFGSGASGAVAVNDITLEVRPGELFFLLGPSGCGKTTLLRMIAGFTEPTAGRIRFDARDVTAVAASRRNTGMVFQSYALWPHMTVEANVGFGLDVRGVPAGERARRIADALAAVRMTEYAHRRPNQLSGGQQQRVALARALVVRPDVLLLDEPLSNLDAKLRTELRAELRWICKEYGGADPKNRGITTIYVTHDQKEALSMADRIAIMDRGRIVQSGSAPDLYRRPASRFVAEFLGETNFIECRLVERSGSVVILDTPLGRLSASDTDMDLNPAQPAKALCSIRPEAIRMIASNEGGGVNQFIGQVVGKTYLGDVAQFVVEAAGLQLKIAALNPPSDILTRSTNARVMISVDPSDIVLLP